MVLSRGVAPHHLGLRDRVIRCAVWSMLVMMNGPAEGPGWVSWALLNASGVSVILLVNSIVCPENMPFHSAYGLANVMTACRSSTPRVTEATRSLPLVPAIANVLSLPLGA